MDQRGLLIVVSSPSGTGKGTVLGRLRERSDKIRSCISITTRQPRDYEINGRDYRFVSVDEFRKLADSDELLEWVEYIGNLYGTPVKGIEEMMAQGYDVILEKEVQGAMSIKARYPDSVLIFLVPPSLGELRRRIESRGTESLEIINERLDRARIELGYIDKYDYIVVNDTVDDTVDKLYSILNAEKLSANRNIHILKQLGIG